MKEEAATDAVLRQFLLGRVEDEERQRIESLFLTDPLMKDAVVAAEQELIDDYVEDRLPPADLDAFLSLYGDTAVQRRKLRIAKSIQEWAVDQAKTSPVTQVSSLSGWQRLREQLRVKPILLIPLAVAATAAIVLAIVWVNSRTNERNREYLAMQQELAQLNSPSSLREAPPNMPRLVLKPGSVRSVETESVLTKRADTSVAELRLLWMQRDDYQTYEATLRRPGDDRPHNIPNLTVDKEEGKVIRVRLPTHLLIRGDYQIEVTGVSADRTSSASEVYRFTVSE